jgi:crossover junction endodeoxyribonuclease RuvC
VLAAGAPVFEYSPRAVKQAVVGGGAADKAQVEHMVKIILSLQQQVAEDEADALAVAICHAHTQGLTRGRLAGGGGA